MSGIQNETPMAALAAAIQARVPVLLWGPPGIGKTAQIEQICARHQWGLVALSTATMLPEDVGGLPVPRDGSVDHLPIWWVDRAVRLAEERGCCVVLLDEFSCTPGAVQAALLTVVQSRRAGSRELPREVAWVACANPVDQAAGGWELPPPTISRWLHLDWPTPTLDEWTSWLLRGAVRPDDPPQGAWATERGARARGLVAGFLRRSPQALCAIQERGDSSPYPCPRSWEHAARAMAEVIPAAGALAPSLGLTEQLVGGCVGHSTALTFASWVREADLPDPEELLAHPESWVVPTGRPDRAMATLAGVVGAVTARATQPRYDAAVDLLVTAARGGLAGPCVVAMVALLGHPAVSGLRDPGELAQLGAVVEAARPLIQRLHRQGVSL